jgi:hypothetical protein
MNFMYSDTEASSKARHLKYDPFKYHNSGYDLFLSFI